MCHTPEGSPLISLTRETERFSLTMSIVRMGSDLNVSLFGGDAPHVGAVALAQPHPGLRTPEKTDASVSVLAVTGHKEDRLAAKVAQTLASALDSRVCVACGIHLDNGSGQEIQTILRVADAILEEALDILG